MAAKKIKIDHASLKFRKQSQKRGPICHPESLYNSLSTCETVIGEG